MKRGRKFKSSFLAFFDDFRLVTSVFLYLGKNRMEVPFFTRKNNQYVLLWGEGKWINLRLNPF